ncbi:MAG: O-antigen ligase family protein [Patescibacteria group bacterium]
MIQKTINFIIYLIVFSLPLYLVCFKIAWVPVTILELMIYVLFIIWLSYFIIKKEKITDSKFYLPLLLIFLGATISTLFSSDIQVSAGIWKAWFVAPMLFFVVVINNIKTKKQIKNIIISLVSSGSIVALISLFYWFNGNLTYDNRLQAFYNSPNYLAMFLSPILILSFYLYFLVKNKIVKTLLIVDSLLLITVIYLTYSYGAWLGLMGAAIFIFIFLKFKLRYIFLFFLIIILFFSFQASSYKFQGFLDFSYPSLKSRLVIWQSSWEIIKDHSLIGVGPGMFQKYYLDEQVNFEPYLEWAVPQPHNIFLAFWLQTGLIGLIGFLWLIIILFKNYKPKILNSILLCAIIYILIHGLIDTTYWKNDLVVVFWLIIALNYKVSYLPSISRPIV